MAQEREHPLRDVCRGGCAAAGDERYGTRERWDPIIDVVLGRQSPRSQASRNSAGSTAVAFR